MSNVKTRFAPSPDKAGLQCRNLRTALYAVSDQQNTMTEPLCSVSKITDQDVSRKAAL